MGRTIELLLLHTCGTYAIYSGIAYAPDVDETIEDESSRAYLQLQQDVSLDAVQVKLRMVAGIESWSSFSCWF